MRGRRHQAPFRPPSRLPSQDISPLVVSVVMLLEPVAGGAIGWAVGVQVGAAERGGETPVLTYSPPLMPHRDHLLCLLLGLRRCCCLVPLVSSLGRVMEGSHPVRLQPLCEA